MCAEYPVALRRALIKKHLFDAWFELKIAMKAASRGDTIYIAGSTFRAAGFMILVLYALNRRYYVNEKGAFLDSRGFATKQAGFHDAVGATLACVGDTPEDLTRSVAAMESALAALKDLCGTEFAGPR